MTARQIKSRKPRPNPSRDDRKGQVFVAEQYAF